MRHRNRRGKLGKKTEHRIAMLRNMAASLFDKERIKTTLPKAKQLRPFAEKLITLARKQDLHARRLMLQHIHNAAIAKKLFEVIAIRYKDAKDGGYTRIVPYRTRWGDGAELAFVELTTFATPVDTKDQKKGKKEKAAAGKKEASAKKEASGKKEAAPKKEAKKKESKTEESK